MSNDYNQCFQAADKFGQNRPVLKHGPRSLTRVRVVESQILVRSESNPWESSNALHHGPLFAECV